MLPTPYVLSVRRWQTGTTPNAHGYSEGSHGAPETFSVHSVAPGPSLEAMAAGRTTAQVAWTVYAPAGVSINSKDLVTFNGTEYGVVGDSLSYTFSPWVNPIAGVTFELKKMEG